MRPLGKAPTPSVSVVLATYNGARFLERQLHTLAAQTEPPSELIVGDDHSEDATAEIIRRFARIAPFPVRLRVHAERVGFRRNFMHSVARATGELILFCDQDDIWLDGKIAAIRRAFAGDPDLMLVYHNAEIADADGRPGAGGTMFDSAFERELVAADRMPPWHYARGLVQAFRRELTAYDDLWSLSREHFSDEPLGHDRWYFLIGAVLGRIAYLDTPLLLYRQHGANAFGADWTISSAERVRRAVTRQAEAERLQARAAGSREDVLRRIAERMTPNRQDRPLAWAERYGDLAARLARKEAIYTAPGMLRRMRALATAVLNNDYRGAPWAFRLAAVPRDLLGGVLLGGNDPGISSRNTP